MGSTSLEALKESWDQGYIWGYKDSAAAGLGKESYAHLICVSSEEPLLSGLDLQGHYNSMAGVDHCSVVLSPQRLQHRDRNERAADPPEVPQVLGWAHRDFCNRRSAARVQVRGCSPIQQVLF